MVTPRHSAGSQPKLATTGGSSPPASHARSTGVSRSASVADELSYSPLKHAHQNHRLSFARRAPRSGPEALSTVRHEAASGISIGRYGSHLPTSTPHSLRRSWT